MVRTRASAATLKHSLASRYVHRQRGFVRIRAMSFGMHDLAVEPAIVDPDMGYEVVPVNYSAGSDNLRRAFQEMAGVNHQRQNADLLDGWQRRFRTYRADMQVAGSDASAAWHLREKMGLNENRPHEDLEVHVSQQVEGLLEEGTSSNGGGHGQRSHNSSRVDPIRSQGRWCR